MARAIYYNARKHVFLASMQDTWLREITGSKTSGGQTSNLYLNLAHFFNTGDN
jgi:hypothetical protein